MTNTLNTLVKAMEYAHPLRVTRYEIRLMRARRYIILKNTHRV